MLITCRLPSVCSKKVYPDRKMLSRPLDRVQSLPFLTQYDTCFDVRISGAVLATTPARYSWQAVPAFVLLLLICSLMIILASFFPILSFFPVFFFFF